MNRLYLNDGSITYLKKISTNDYPVLITGSSGVGKNFVAEYIHYNSNRKSYPVINIDLSTIPIDLIEKELYGAVPGSFTGIDNEYEGKFALANKGSVILSGIDEIPITVQGKLLQVLDKGIYYPIGSNEPYITDIRIISISSKDLSELADKGLFRRDLLYRINTLNFNVPNLEERKEFIPQIINDRLNNLTKGSELSVKGISRILNHSWKGNIRELLNLVDKEYALRDGNEITFDSLLLSSDNTVNITSKKLKDAVSEFKKQFIADALERNSGNVTKCAKELGVQRTYLSRLIKELKLARG